jgi:peptidoglycan/xylan/chitin deacetylase (PgdA/CDA1 family)
MPFRESHFAPWLVTALLAACAAPPRRPPGREAGADAREADGARPETADAAVPPDVEIADAEPPADAEEDTVDPSIITSNGCAGGACLNPTCQPLGEPAAPGRFLEVGFEPRAPYLPGDVIIPTLDDAPDGEWSGPLLDWLDANHLHLDLFVDTAHRCDVAVTPACAAVLERILRAHNPANHTAHHVHLGSDCHALGADAAVACEDEITVVESEIQVLSNGGIAHLSRFRAPFGEPFRMGGVALDEMKGVVARFAVEVGWAIDAGDGDAGGVLDAATATANVVRALDAGDRGIVRLPATAPWSLDVLKALLDPKAGYAATHHLRAATVEDAICWRYGRHSWELVSQITGHRVGEN